MFEGATSQFQTAKPLAPLSTSGIGGPARLFVEVHSTEEMQAVLCYSSAHNLPYFILGKGSNSLFDDRGFDGLVILNKIAFCQCDWPIVHVGAGYSFSLIGTQTARQGWTGLEFASGIPGSVGGAVYMNAGANEAEVCESLLEVTCVNAAGEIELLKREEIAFDYRFSSFQARKGAICSAKFLLHPSTGARQKQLEIIAYRTRTQPYSDKSAGCIFRNPTAHSAGALIEQSGLKGKRIGGAEVSTVHANFIVNKAGATAEEILALAAFVKQAVKEKKNVDLEMELRCVPYRPLA